MPVFTEDEKRKLVQLEGLNPDQYDYDESTDSFKKKQTLQPTITGPSVSPLSKQSQNITSTAGAFGANAAAGVLPTTGGLLGAIPGAKVGGAIGAGIGGPPGALIGGILGGGVGALGGSLLTSKAQEYALDKVAPDVNQYLATAQSEHPYASTAGNIAAALPMMRPDPRLIGEAGGAISKVLAKGGTKVLDPADINALANVGMGAGLGVSSAAYDISQTGRDVDARDLLNVIGNVVLNNPRPYLKQRLKLPFDTNEEVRASVAPMRAMQQNDTVVDSAALPPEVLAQAATEKLSPERAIKTDEPIASSKDIAQAEREYTKVLSKNVDAEKEILAERNKQVKMEAELAAAQKESDELQRTALESYSSIPAEKRTVASKAGEKIPFIDKPLEPQMVQVEAPSREVVFEDPVRFATVKPTKDVPTIDPYKNLVEGEKLKMQAEELEMRRAAAEPKSFAEQETERLTGQKERYSKESKLSDIPNEIRARMDAVHGEGKWGVTNAFRKLMDTLAQSRRIALKYDSAQPQAGSFKEGTATINPQKEGLDTSIHEVKHGLNVTMAESKSAFDRAMMQRGFDAAAKSPEFKRWYDSLSDAKKAELASKPFDVNGVKAAGAVEEFLTEHVAYGVLKTERKLSGETPWEQWKKDFLSHMNVRFGKNARLADHLRLQSNRLRYDAPYTGDAPIVKTTREQDSAKLKGELYLPPTYDNEKTLSENVKALTEYKDAYEKANPNKPVEFEFGQKPFTTPEDAKGARYRSDARYSKFSELEGKSSPVGPSKRMMDDAEFFKRYPLLEGVPAKEWRDEPLSEYTGISESQIRRLRKKGIDDIIEYTRSRNMTAPKRTTDAAVVRSDTGDIQYRERPQRAEPDFENPIMVDAVKRGVYMALKKLPSFVKDNAASEAIRNRIYTQNLITGDDYVRGDLQKEITQAVIAGLQKEGIQSSKPMEQAIFEDASKMASREFNKMYDSYARNAGTSLDTAVGDSGVTVGDITKAQPAITGDKRASAELTSEEQRMLDKRNASSEQPVIDIGPQSVVKAAPKDTIPKLVDTWEQMVEAFKNGDAESQHMFMAVEKLKPRLEAAGMKPADIQDLLLGTMEEIGLIGSSDSSDFASAKEKYSEESKLTPAQRQQIETPEFKQWFGDSKIVDENGEPLVVYHGTTAEFSKFKGSGKEIGWFTAYPDTAEIYAGVDRDLPYNPSYKYGHIMPVYLSIKKPAPLSSKNRINIEKLKAEGYDGLIGYNPYGEPRTFVAFYPEQIKSATGNRGTFDPSNPDIRYSEDSRLFVTQTEKELRRDKPFGLNVNNDGTINKDAIRGAMAKLNPLEHELLKSAGWNDYFSALGSKVKATTLADWIRNNGPKIEVHSYGMEGKVSEAKREYDRMTHEWADTLPHKKYRELRNAIGERPIDITSEDYLKKAGWEGEELTKALKYIRLQERMYLEPRDTSPRATSAYDTVSALPTNEPMPEWTATRSNKNVQRVDVVVPIATTKEQALKVLRDSKYYSADDLAVAATQPAEELLAMMQHIKPGRYKNGKNPILWQPDNLHENLPNTLGWAMIQYKTGPNGEKIAVIAEAQSKWGQTATRYKKMYQEKLESLVIKEHTNGLNTWATIHNKKAPDGPSIHFSILADAQAYREKQARDAAYYRNEAYEPDRNDHPLLRDYNRLILKSAIDQARKEGATHIMVSDAKTAMMTERLDNSLQMRFSSPKEARDHNAKMLEKYDLPDVFGIQSESPSEYFSTVDTDGIRSENRLEVIESLREDGYRVNREGGFRVNYDTQMPSIARDITGDAGTRVSLGDHKNAYTIKAESGQTARFRTAEEAEAYARGRKATPRENLIFTNPDGTPKTDVSGMLYDISLPASRLESGEQMTMSGKRFSEISKLNPMRYIQPELDALESKLTPDIAQKVIPAFDKADRQKSAYYGEFGNRALGATDKLLPSIKDKILGSNASTKKVLNAFYYESDHDTTAGHIHLTKAEKDAMSEIRETLKGMHETQIKEGPLVARIGANGDVTYGEPITNPHYFPHMMDGSVIQKLMTHPDSAEAELLRNQFKDYRRSLGQSEESIHESLKRFQPSKAGGAKIPDFNAVRIEEGLGLPMEWREKDLTRVLRRFSDRWSSDMAFYKHVQSDPVMRRLLDIKDDGRGNIGESVKATDLDGRDISDININSMPEVQTIMRDWTRNYPVSDLKINAVNRTIKSFMMQTMTGTQDVISAIPSAMKFVRPSELGVLPDAILNVKKGIEIGLRNGTIKRGASAYEDLRGLDSGFSNIMDGIAATTNKVFGREALETVSRGLTNAVGALLGESRLASARAGNKRDIKWIEELGLITDWRNDDVVKVVDDIAGRFTELNQSTYNYRDLPRWAIEGSVAPFVSLAKWNISQFNNFNKTVVKELREGNPTPLLMATVGAILGGAAVEEIRQLITKRKPNQLTNEEFFATGEDAAYKFAALASLSGFAGIGTEMVKTAMDISRGNRPQGFTFPFAEVVANTTDRIAQLAQAIDAGTTFNEAFLPFAQSLLTDHVQMARIGFRQFEPAEEAKRADTQRDSRVFKQVVMGESVPLSARSNPMIRPSEKEFKRTESIEDAARMLPQLLDDAMKRSGGDYEKMKKEFHRLKVNSIQTFPSPEQWPIEFAAQVQWLQKTKGQKAAQEAVSNFLRQREINKVKSSMVPSI